MAGNDQFAEEAFQKAQGIASAISQRKESFLMSAPLDYIACANSALTAGCSSDLSPLDSAIVAVPAGIRLSYSVQRRGPKLLKALPFRIEQRAASSSLAYDAAVFETRVHFDGSAAGLGSAEVAQGVAVMVSGSVQ